MTIGLSISEYGGAVGSGADDISEGEWLADQAVAIGGSSTQSAAFQTNTNKVVLTPDASCSIKFGVSPTATTTSKYLASGVTRVFRVPAGGVWKVAVITNS